jgi:hypothetical protein
MGYIPNGSENIGFLVVRVTNVFIFGYSAVYSVSKESIASKSGENISRIINQLILDGDTEYLSSHLLLAGYFLG